MFSHTLVDHVYGSYIVLMTGNRDEIKKAVLDYDPKFDGDMDFVGRCIETSQFNNDHFVIVMLPEWQHGARWNARDISALGHELFHATAFVMKEHDISYSEETQAAWAYYFDHLLRRALEVLA